MRRTLLLPALLALAATLTLPVVVMAGSPTTRWVDGDGTAGPTGCDTATAASATIQGAVDAAAAGDTILVCPGRYRELVVVATDGLTIRPTEKWAAELRPPTDAENEADLLTVHDAQGVRILWLKLVAPTSGDCERIEAMVRAEDAPNVSVRGLRIRATNGDTIDGPCGYNTGVVVTGTSSGIVGFNLIVNFQNRGVLIREEVGEVEVRGNSIRWFHHPDETFAEDGVGIDSRSGSVKIINNVIQSAEGAGDTSLELRQGIEISADSPFPVGVDPDPALIRGNRILYVQGGIDVEISDTNGLDGIRILRNVLVASQDNFSAGLEANEVDEGVVRRNDIRGFTWAIVMGEDSDDFRIEENVFLDSELVDCRDESDDGGGTAGTANFWTDNTGNTDDPDGICIPEP